MLVMLLWVVTLRQPVAVAVFPERQVSLRPLFGVSLLIIQPVLFQHCGQPQPEFFQAEHVPVAVGLHIDQIGVIEIVTGLAREDIGVPHKHPVRLRQRFQIITKIKRQISVAFDAERLVGVLLRLEQCAGAHRVPDQYWRGLTPSMHLH